MKLGWEEEGSIKMASGKQSELNTPNDATDGRELREKLALSSTLSQSLSLHHHPDSFWDSSPASPETKRLKPEAEPELAVEVSRN